MVARGAGARGGAAFMVGSVPAREAGGGPGGESGPGEVSVFGIGFVWYFWSYLPYPLKVKGDRSAGKAAFGGPARSRAAVAGP